MRAAVGVLSSASPSPSPPPAAGVTVRVEGLFHALPVRQASTRAVVEFDRIRAAVVAYALAFPGVSVTLRDTERASDARVILQVPAVRTTAERMLQLFGGESVDVVYHGGTGVEIYINVMRGITHASHQMQFVHVNGVPVSNASWLLKPLVRGLSSLARGPQQAGVPRTCPVLLMQITCAEEDLEWIPWHALDEEADDASPGSGAHAAVTFAQKDAVLDVAEIAASYLGVASLRVASVSRSVPRGSGARLPASSTIKDIRSAPRSSRYGTHGGGASPAAAASPTILGQAARSSSSKRGRDQDRDASDVVRGLIQEWESPRVKPEVALQHQQPLTELVSLRREHLESFRVVGQVHAKVVIVLLENKYLVALDQHAVSERIILERLQERLLQGEVVIKPRSEFVRMDSALLDAASRWQVPLSRWWQFRIQDGGAQIMGAALCCEDDQVTGADMLEYLHDLIASEGLQRMPRAVDRLLAFRACRGAIKFGDVLDHACMNKLVADLAKCSYPFQCAHGRQSLMLLRVLA